MCIASVSQLIGAKCGMCMAVQTSNPPEPRQPNCGYVPGGFPSLPPLVIAHCPAAHSRLFTPCLMIMLNS